MAYVSPNYKTKAALRKAIADGQSVSVYQPGLGEVPTDGAVPLGGPHYPAPHTWYGTGTMKNGVLVKVK